MRTLTLAELESEEAVELAPRRLMSTYINSPTIRVSMWSQTNVTVYSGHGGGFSFAGLALFD